MSRKGLKRLVIGFWVINLLLGLVVLGAWMMSSASRVRAFFISPTPTSTSTTTPTATLTQTSTPSPTKTTTSTSTPIPTETLTPSPVPSSTNTAIPFSEGPLVIGFSVEDRPLEVYRFGTGPNGRMIVAGMHGGGEYNTIQLADQLISFINDHPQIIPPKVTLYILRNLNPDGEARSHNGQGRANAHGVDLNRNWDANWQKDWSRDNCWNLTYVTAGSKPASEPETQALMAFILSHPLDAIINYHSAALGIFAGGLPPEPDTLSLAKAVASVTDYPYPPVNIGCTYTGGFTDWADEHGVPALDVELSDHTHTDYEMNLLVLNVLLDWKPQHKK